MTFFDNTKLKVRMNGKEYVDYLKYKKIKLSKNQQFAMWIFLFCGLGIVLLVVLINDLTYTPPPPTEYTYYDFWGYPITSVVVHFLLISIGIAWILHGFGFILVRR